MPRFSLVGGRPFAHHNPIHQSYSDGREQDQRLAEINAREQDQADRDSDHRNEWTRGQPEPGPSGLTPAQHG